MSKPIPEAALIAAELRLCRKFAAVLIGALADAGLTLREVDYRIGAKPGWAKNVLDRLIDGSARGDDTSLRDIADFATALACEIDFSFTAKSEVAE